MTDLDLYFVILVCSALGAVWLALVLLGWDGEDDL